MPRGNELVDGGVVFRDGGSRGIVWCRFIGHRSSLVKLERRADVQRLELLSPTAGALGLVSLR